MKFQKLSALAATYCVNVAVLAMLFLSPGQANAACIPPTYAPGLVDDLIIECNDGDDWVIVRVTSGILQVSIDGSGATTDLGPAAPLAHVVITTEGGSDTVIIEELEAGVSIEIDTGRGPDILTVGPEVEASYDVVIETGRGKDEINVGLNVSAGGSVKVNAGPGRDFVQIYSATGFGLTGIEADGDISINGGDGDPDTIGIIQGDTITAGGNQEIINFEKYQSF